MSKYFFTLFLIGFGVIARAQNLSSDFDEVTLIRPPQGVEVSQSETVPTAVTQNDLIVDLDPIEGEANSFKSFQADGEEAAIQQIVNQGFSREEAVILYHKRLSYSLNLKAFLKKVRVPEKIAMSISEEFDNQLSKSTTALLRPNHEGFSIQIHGVTSFGFNKAWLEDNKDKKWAKFIPRRGHFALVLGLGASIVRLDSAQGPRLRIRLFADAEKLSHIKTFIAMAGVSVAYSEVNEFKTSNTFKQKMSKNYIGYNIIQAASADHFSKGFGDGLGVIPGFMSIPMNLTTDATRFNVVDFTIPEYKALTFLSLIPKGIYNIINQVFLRIRGKICAQLLLSAS